MLNHKEKDEFYNLQAVVCYSRNILIILSASFLLCLVLSLTNIAPGPLKQLNLSKSDFLLDTAFFGAFIISIIMRRTNRNEFLANLLLGIVIGATLLFWGDKNIFGIGSIAKYGAGLGISSLLFLIIPALKSNGKDRIKLLSVLYPAMILPYYSVQSYFYLGLTP